MPQNVACLELFQPCIRRAAVEEVQWFWRRGLEFLVKVWVSGAPIPFSLRNLGNLEPRMPAILTLSFHQPWHWGLILNAGFLGWFFMSNHRYCMVRDPPTGKWQDKVCSPSFLSKWCFYSFCQMLTMLTRSQVLNEGSPRWTCRSRNAHRCRATPASICKVFLPCELFFFGPQLRSQPSSWYGHNSTNIQLQQENHQVFSIDFASTSKTIPCHLIALITAAITRRYASLQCTPFPQLIWRYW